MNFEIITQLLYTRLKRHTERVSLAKLYHHHRFPDIVMYGTTFRYLIILTTLFLRIQYFCLVEFKLTGRFRSVSFWTGQCRHYTNISVQYTAIFHGCKNGNFQMKKYDSFLIFAQNTDRGYTLEPPYWGGSNEYPWSMFWSKNKKKM